MNSREEYDEWAKTRAEFVVSYEDIKVEDGKVMMYIRNGDYELRVGDCMGGAFVVKIEAYEKDLDSLCGGITARVTLDDMPCFIVHQMTPENAEWIKDRRKERKSKLV